MIKIIENIICKIGTRKYIKKNMEWLMESKKQLENGEVVEKTMEELKEMEK